MTWAGWTCERAGYWYRRAGQPVADGPVEAERRAIAEALTGTR